MRLQGKSVFGGIAMGKLAVYEKKERTVKREKREDADAEMQRFYEAKEEAKRQLGVLYEKALKEVGEANAAIFDVHQMMLDDQDYEESIEHIIREQKVNAEYAVAQTGDNFSEIFAAMDDDYMRMRAADVKDISDRVIAVLQGGKDKGFAGGEPVILLAEDLAPSETVQLDKEKVLSFVTKFGSTNSHTAILARTMNIPALIGIDFPKDCEGAFGIVDGFEGALYIDPDEETIALYEKKKQKEEERRALLQELKGKENVTKDGTRVELFANIGSVADVGAALQNDAGGIGLFRSEFLYIGAEDYPSEEQQFQAYRTVAQNMAGKKVVIRTLDIGADKKADYFGLDPEENPALGFRAIRICLQRPQILKTQLRAIFRAACYGNISVMYPMITSLREVERIKEIVEEVKEELLKDGLPFGEVEQGIMIETPAAVFMSAELAKEVDFFSIGTNDLTQYLLACDRQNPNLADVCDPYHPAVLRAIEMTVKNAHAGGAWVGICGELGGDVRMTETFLRMGVDELSVSPPRILEVRDAIRRIDLKG